MIITCETKGHEYVPDINLKEIMIIEDGDNTKLKANFTHMKCTTCGDRQLVEIDFEDSVISINHTT